jgi:hypothetical protein
MNGDDVQAALWEAVRLAEELHLPYALVGALTLGVYGRGRATNDVDLMIAGTSQALQTIRDICGARGFSVDETWEQYHPDVRDVQLRLNFRGVPVDLMLPRDAQDKEAFQRRHQQPAGTSLIWVVTREDFILQKLKAGRPRDFDDVIPFFARHRDELDHQYLNLWALRLGVREELDYLWSRSEQPPRA